MHGQQPCNRRAALPGGPGPVARHPGSAAAPAACAVLYKLCNDALPPHPHPAQVDVEFMRELAALVPVVPILAKADTMTGEELRVGQQCCRGGGSRVTGRVLCVSAWMFFDECAFEGFSVCLELPQFSFLGYI